jgi:hypothetical protein
MENIFGGLIEFKSKSEFDSFIENITKEEALQIVELSILFAQQSGLYSLEESHSLYK